MWANVVEIQVDCIPSEKTFEHVEEVTEVVAPRSSRTNESHEPVNNMLANGTAAVEFELIKVWHETVLQDH